MTPTGRPRRLHAVRQARICSSTARPCSSARRLGVDLDWSAGAAGSAAAARSRLPTASTRSTASRPLRRIRLRQESLEALRRRARPRRGASSRLHGVRRRRSRRRRPARKSALPPGRAQGGRRAPDRARSGRARLHYVELVDAELGESTGDLRRLKDALASEWDLPALGVDFHVLAELQPRCGTGTVP